MLKGGSRIKRILKLIIKIPVYLCFDFIYFFSWIFPKDSNLWIFGAWFGEKYADNSKYLFEHINKNHPEIRTIWLTKNKNTLKLIRSKRYEAYLTYSLKGFLLSMKSKVTIVCVGLCDVNMSTVSNAQIVHLWHGIPLKKIMFDDRINFKVSSRIRKFIVKKFFPFLWRNYSKYMLIATSPEIQRVISGAFKAPICNVKVTGYPRNDVFFMKTVNVPIKSKLLFLRENNKIGIYMPTHRREGKFDIASFFINDIEFLNSRSKELNIILLVKLHYYHLESLEHRYFNYSNIIFIKDKDIDQDIYSILPNTDFLITDYSGTYFDYLLLNKPIIFAPFDMEDYLKNDREFYYNYDEVTPGPKAKNWHEIFMYIKEAIKYPKKYENERKKICKLFNIYNDANSSERVYREICNRL